MVASMMNTKVWMKAEEEPHDHERHRHHQGRQAEEDAGHHVLPGDVAEQAQAVAEDPGEQPQHLQGPHEDPEEPHGPGEAAQGLPILFSRMPWKL